MRIAVTGSTGNVGGQVMRLLADADQHQVVALTRRRRSGGPNAVTAVYADYADLASLQEALNGVDVLVFVSSDGDAAKMMVHHQNVVRAAVRNDVSHIVYLSGIDADLESPFCYAYTNGYAEQLLRSSGCGFSIARASIFTEFFTSFLRRALASGEIRLPAQDGRLSLVSRADVGRCLATLATSTPSGHHHDITGPAALDMHAVAEIASRAWSTRLRYVEVLPTTFSAELADDGHEPWWIYAYSTMFASVRERRWDVVTDDVLQLTGRPPLTLADVLRTTPPGDLAD